MLTCSPNEVWVCPMIWGTSLHKDFPYVLTRRFLITGCKRVLFELVHGHFNPVWTWVWKELNVLFYLWFLLRWCLFSCPCFPQTTWEADQSSDAQKCVCPSMCTRNHWSHHNYTGHQTSVHYPEWVTKQLEWPHTLKKFLFPLCPAMCMATLPAKIWAITAPKTNQTPKMRQKSMLQQMWGHVRTEKFTLMIAYHHYFCC